MEMLVNTYNSSGDESDISRTRLRRLKKPLIEKKRRERINKSLTCLKAILLENIKRNGGTQTSKMDKADILEMAVTYLRMLQYGQSAMMTSCESQYNLGYQDCANEALRYLGEVRCHSNDVTSRLSNHLYHTQPILESSKVDNYPEIHENRMPVALDIPTAHAQFKHQQTSASLRFLFPVELQDTAKYSKYSTDGDSLTSGYSSQPEARSLDAMSIDSSDQIPYVESRSCSPDSDRSMSSSPADVWRPW